MNKDKVKQIVLDIISEIAPDEDLSDVKPEIRLRDQLDLDSMDFLDIVMEIKIVLLLNKIRIQVHQKNLQFPGEV